MERRTVTTHAAGTQVEEDSHYTSSRDTDRGGQSVHKQQGNRERRTVTTLPAGIQGV